MTLWPFTVWYMFSMLLTCVMRSLTLEVFAPWSWASWMAPGWPPERPRWTPPGCSCWSRRSTEESRGRPHKPDIKKTKVKYQYYSVNTPLLFCPEAVAADVARREESVAAQSPWTGTRRRKRDSTDSHSKCPKNEKKMKRFFISPQHYHYRFLLSVQSSNVHLWQYGSNRTASRSHLIALLSHFASSFPPFDTTNAYACVADIRQKQSQKRAYTNKNRNHHKFGRKIYATSCKLLLSTFKIL